MGVGCYREMWLGAGIPAVENIGFWAGTELNVFPPIYAYPLQNGVVVLLEAALMRT